MYKEFDAITLISGEKVTIIEVYDDTHFMVEKVEEDGTTSDLFDISIDAINQTIPPRH